MTDSHDERPGYQRFDPEDEEFFGAKEVVRAEYARIWQRRTWKDKATSPDFHRTDRPDNMVGIALSGGGIRSASVCLGVLQALAHSGWLKRADYLSTVSGGGYIGSSLTWLLHKTWKVPNPVTPVDLNFGVESTNFPYGLYPVAEDEGTARGEHYTFRGRLLRYLRQNGRYLIPGRGIGALSLLAVIVRNSIYSSVVYGTLLLLLFLMFGPWLYSALSALGWSGQGAGHSLGTGLLIVLLGAFLTSIPIYAWWTGSAHLSGTARQYLGRRRYEKYAGRGAAAVISLGILLLLPPVHAEILSLTSAMLNAHWVSRVTGTAAGEAPPIALGTLSTLLGVISSVAAFFRSQSEDRSRVLVPLLVTVGTVALVFGLLLLSYDAYWRIDQLFQDRRVTYRFLTAALWVVFFVTARFVNSNYMSVHRFYRDRLMEAFMPNVPEALNVDGIPGGVSLDADTAPLHAMWPRTDKYPPGPYPIINTNVVLVSSNIPKFRGRGGDNFILSPYFCGSNATGWIATNPFFDWMTLASAMSISGAAVNPNTGVGGDGVTRQPLLSFLMGLLNIRLGYWVLNPMPRQQRMERLRSQGLGAARTEIELELAEWLSPTVPNALWPGVAESFLGRYMEENSHMLQLTDGGHFENLGLYELVRRKLSLIVVCDAAANSDYSFGDLANAIEKVRADFGVLVRIDAADLQALTPGAGGSKPTADVRTTFAKRGYLVAPIEYPSPGGGKTTGTLIYIASTFFRSLSADLYGYRRANPAFPQQSTANQFFDERQFDAYRELGFQTCRAMLADSRVTGNRHVMAAMNPGGH